MRTLLIEGWRGINHSFAMVNQHQMLALTEHRDLRLLHRDLPFVRPDWRSEALDPGFSAEDAARIGAVPAPSGEPVDCVYSIVKPTRLPPERSVRRLIFVVTELGLMRTALAQGLSPGDFARDAEDYVVTPSRWSRDLLAGHGFDPARIRILSHGVDSRTFAPLDAGSREASRAALGVGRDETVFLNLGGALWNKGVDLLLVAFARLRRTAPGARLIVKDQRALYGVTVSDALGRIATEHPGLFDEAVVGAIRVVPDTLSQQQLRALYAVADCYVSPYRGEGFNLPALEAIASGTPVVVTAGGATDDFCNDDVAVRVPSAPCVRDSDAHLGPLRYREPDPEALLCAMRSFTEGPGLDRMRFDEGRRRLVARLDWREVSRELHALCLGEPIAA